MAKEKLYTMVAGRVLELDTVYNVKCNCGGDAPIKPKSVTGYGYSKKGGAMKIVDKFETKCKTCESPIAVLVVEGDPGYMLTSKGGVSSLFLPQGSTSAPVSELSIADRKEILDHMQVQAAIAEKKRKKKENDKKKKKKK